MEIHQIEEQIVDCEDGILRTIYHLEKCKAGIMHISASRVFKEHLRYYNRKVGFYKWLLKKHLAKILNTTNL